MAYLKIVLEGDPVLRKVSRPVTEITPRILQLLDDMTATMRRANGCGQRNTQRLYGKIGRSQNEYTPQSYRDP